MYSDMLNQAVRALKAGREPDLSAPLAVVTEINLHVPARLPDEYCGDIHDRLTLYKRLANCERADELQQLQEEIIDRFGTPPDATRALIDIHRLRLLATPLGITRIDASSETIQIQFGAQPMVAPERIIELIHTRKDARLAGQDRLRFSIKTGEHKERVTRIRDLLSLLAAPSAKRKEVMR